MSYNFMIALAGFLSGLVGAMGLGGGGVLIIYLTVIANMEQVTAQGINIIFFMAIALIAIFMYNRKKLISWKIVIPYSAVGILGAIAGAIISSHINSKLLSTIFGVLLLIMGIKQLLTKSKK